MVHDDTRAAAPEVLPAHDDESTPPPPVKPPKMARYGWLLPFIIVVAAIAIGVRDPFDGALFFSLSFLFSLPVLWALLRYRTNRRHHPRGA